MFLHPSRVRPANHLHGPSLALSSVVCLLGAQFYPEALAELENIFLTRSLTLVSNALSGDHPHKVIYALQAEILLCNYFFRNGRLLEGQYHTSAAVSLAISCGLWRIRSSRPNVPAVGQISGPASLLPPANNLIEEGERIRGFWTVLILDKSWAVALNSRSHFSDRENDPGTQIDTPWPLDIEGYEQVRILLLFLTVKKINLINNLRSRDNYSRRRDLDSPFAISWMDQRSTTTRRRWLSMLKLPFYSIMQTILRESGHRVSTCFSLSTARNEHHFMRRGMYLGMSLQDTNAFSAAFNSANYIIANFRTKLLSPAALTALNLDKRRIFVVANTLVYASAFALHAIFIQSTQRSREICVSAALEVVKVIEAVDILGLRYTNPIVGVSLQYFAGQFHQYTSNYHNYVRLYGKWLLRSLLMRFRGSGLGCLQRGQRPLSLCSSQPSRN